MCSSGSIDIPMILVWVYVPLEHAEALKQAMFSAGAGQIGQYDHCAWQTLGQGQFRPLAGSQPSIGHHNVEQRLDELKIELVCSENTIVAVLDALLEAHPYETPAYGAIRFLSRDDFAGT